MKKPYLNPVTEVHLTPREKEVMHLVSKGMFDKEVASSLGICLQTVKNILYNVYTKMNVSNRVEAIIVFKEIGGGQGVRA